MPATVPVLPVALRMSVSTCAIVGSTDASWPFCAASCSTFTVPPAQVKSPFCAPGLSIVRWRVVSLGWWTSS